MDGNFIPRIIGKGGETIRAVREKYDVSWVKITWLVNEQFAIENGHRNGWFT